MNGGVLNAIVRFAIHFRGIVVALATALVGYALYALVQARYDVFPEFAPPQVVIQTEAPGLASEEVETLVTQVVENSINGVPGIDALRSASIQGLSLVTVVFDPATDIYRDRQVVSERLAALGGQLPQGVKAPRMTPLTSSTSVVLVAGLTSETRSLMDLRTVADWTIRPRLLAVPGVAKVSVFGGDVKQLQVQIRPERLVGLDLALDDVVAAARKATGVRGAGFIEDVNQRVVLRTSGQSLTPGELGATVLASHDGARLLLRNVAEVVAAPEPPIGAAAVMGKPAVVLVISQQYGSNTLEVTRGVEAAVAALRPPLESQGMRLHADLFRPASFIETALRNLWSALLLGAVLVVVVLLLFLFDLRTAAISCTAIPLSLLAATVVMQRLGLTLDTMTLGGLAIAIGEVVDDAVIDVENILRRLRQNRSLEHPRPLHQVVLAASIEVRSAIVYATFAVVFVFFPVLTMSGLAGKFFAPLGVAYIFAVLASLVVALTVTPALSMILLAQRDLERPEPPVMRWTKSHYRRILESIEAAPRPVFVGIGILFVAAIAVLPFFGATFLPELNEGHFIVHMSAVPGTSLDESLRIGGRVTDALVKLPFVRLVSQRAGRAELSDDVWGSHYSEFEVELKPLAAEQAEFAAADVRKALGAFPGANFSVKTFLTERVEETISGYRAAVAVNVYGNDLDILDAKAKEIGALLGEVPGAAEVQLQSPLGMPRLVVQLRKADVERFGFKPVDVLDAVETAYQGRVVGQVYDGNRIFDVAVILDRSARETITQVSALPLRSGDGAYLTLGQLAQIYETPGRYQVLHDGARRVQTVTCNVAGRDVGSFVAEARKQVLSKLALPPGTYVEFAGTAAAQARSRRDLLVHSMVAGLAIVLLLSIVSQHWRNLVLILVNLPFALAGGVLAAFATGGLLSLGSMVGFVTLFGITLRNSIMMISHYEHLVTVEGLRWELETALTGAADRLAPIFMTSLVTAFGLLPLAIGTRAAGREIEGPMAIVILGGLATSMVLNLLVLPTLALRFGRFEKDGGASWE